MFKSLCMLPLVGAMFLVGCNSTVTQKDRDRDYDEEQPTEQVVQLSQVPAAVRVTLEKQATDGSIGTIEMDKEDGQAVYDADITIAGQRYDVEVAQDGKLLEKHQASENDKID